MHVTIWDLGLDSGPCGTNVSTCRVGKDDSNLRLGSQNLLDSEHSHV
jgi:hypothetical protein